MSPYQIQQPIDQAVQKLLNDQKWLAEVSKITDPRHPFYEVLEVAMNEVYSAFCKPDVSPAFLKLIKNYWIPIANNFGMWEARYQLEDRLFQLTDKKSYVLMHSLVKRKQKIHQELFQNLVAIVSYYLRESELKNFEILFRQKNIYGIYIKMKRRHQNINYMTDWFGIRILVDTPAQCYKVLRILHYLWRPYPEFFKDYVKNPKPNGYQSIHTSLHCLDGEMVEFQIRTREMDFAAKYGTASHSLYKRLSS